MSNTTNTASKLALFWRFSLTARSPPLCIHLPLSTGHCSFAPRSTPHQRGQAGHRPSPAGYCHPPTAELPKSERDPISTSGPSIFSMSPNRAIASGKSNFSGRSPVCAPRRMADGHFRRAQPSKFAHDCAPNGDGLRRDFLVEWDSFRCSVPLVPFEQANRSAGKKRNEFRPTAPKLPTPRAPDVPAVCPSAGVPVLSLSLKKIQCMVGPIESAVYDVAGVDF